VRTFPFLALLAALCAPAVASAQAPPRTHAEWQACFGRGGRYWQLLEDRARLSDLMRRMDRADIERLLLRQRLDSVERSLDILRGGYSPMPAPAPAPGFGGDYEFRRERDREREYEFRRPAPSPYLAPAPAPLPAPRPAPRPEPFCPDCPPRGGPLAQPFPAPGPIGYTPSPGYQQYSRSPCPPGPLPVYGRPIRVEETRTPARPR
jgi:hypothetical protein